MKKILSFFAAALIAIAVNAQTDFAAPGYNCTADDAVLSNVYGLSLKTDVDPHYIECAEATYNVVLATWSVTATRGCYVSVSLDLGPMYGSNKHIFQVKILDSEGHAKGTLAESAENTASEQVKTLDGTILLPAAGTYTVELYSIRQYGKGTIKNIILTYDSDAPEEMIAVTSIELNKSELALEVDEVEQLAATVLPEDAFDPSVTWQSSDNAVVTVVDGMVTAVAAGTATITATAGEQSATCAVTVSAASVPDVDFTEPLVLSAKKAHLEGAVWKMYDSDTYKLYGDGGSNSVYGTASWTIHVTRPCVVTGKLMGLDKGALYELDLMDAEENILGTIAQPTRKKWSKGDIEMDSINTTLTFPAVGNYTLKLRNTLAWSSGRTAGVTLTFVEELTPAEPQVLYLRPGEWYWEGNQEKFAIYSWADGKAAIWSDYMTLAENETDIWTGTIPAGYTDVIFVRFSNASTTPSWEDNMWNQTVNLTIQEGKDMFSITGWGDYEGAPCTGVWSKYGVAPLADGFYLVGKFGGVDAWDYASLTAEKQFVWNTHIGEGNEEWKVVADLVAGDKVKACYVYQGAITEYFPGGEGNEYVVDENHAGAGKTIYFQQMYNSDWGGQFYIEPNAGSAIHNAAVEAKTVKMMENGQLVIIKNGVKYNALGAELR